MTKKDLIIVIMTWFGIVSGGVLIYAYLDGFWMFVILAAWTWICAEVGKRLQEG
jgi:hypothetical protein